MTTPASMRRAARLSVDSGLWMSVGPTCHPTFTSLQHIRVKTQPLRNLAYGNTGYAGHSHCLRSRLGEDFQCVARPDILADYPPFRCVCETGVELKRDD